MATKNLDGSDLPKDLLQKIDLALMQQVKLCNQAKEAENGSPSQAINQYEFIKNTKVLEPGTKASSRLSELEGQPISK